MNLVQEAIRLHDVRAQLRVIGNGELAFQFIEAADHGDEPCPALIILDLNLPRRSGKEVLRFLRQSKACADVPVLIMTSSSVDQLEVERLGGDRYFQKPTDYSEFMKVGAAIRSLLGSPHNA